jgi:hypothetical protein
MEKNYPSRWLSAGEASALLQGYMPKKTADAWLNNDRKSNPAIPFWVRDGSVRYRTEDLEFFVQRCLSPGSHVDFSERRQRSDRRLASDRRQNPSIRLSPVAERRRSHSTDRRGSLAPDRRLGER